MNKITCDIARDLMPLVIDGIASDDSSAALHTHMENCGDCAQIYAAMQTKEPAPKVEDTAFIQFSRKLERGFRLRNIVAGLLLVLLLGTAGFFGYWWVDGNINGVSVIAPTDCAKAELFIDNTERFTAATNPEGSEGLMHLKLTPDSDRGLWTYNIDFSDQIRLSGWSTDWNLEPASDILYLTPMEPRWLLGRTGSMEPQEQSFAQFYWIDGALRFIRYDYKTIIENGEEIAVTDIDKIISNMPVQEVRWGNPDDYVTLYKSGDVLPFVTE